jgi:hypothetical protein
MPKKADKPAPPPDPPVPGPDMRDPVLRISLPLLTALAHVSAVVGRTWDLFDPEEGAAIWTAAPAGEAEEDDDFHPWLEVRWGEVKGVNMSPASERQERHSDAIVGYCVRAGIPWHRCGDNDPLPGDGNHGH